MTPAQLRRWRIRQLRATQEIAAEALGVSVDGYIKYENGQRPIKPWIVKLTRYITRYGVMD
jgi:hypothetical protein